MTRARDLAAGTFELATGGVLKLETSDTTVTDGSVLGKIEFKAPDEASGTDAILVGAAIEAVAEGTFAADNNATELVFKTGASAAADAKMTLTSAGNLLVGMTSANTNNDGVGLRADGLIHGKRADVVATFNRKTSDGNIVELAKDNTVVGSVGVAGSDLYISGGSSHAGIRFDTNILTPVVNATQTDATVSLGYSSQRFKDLHLSGGVYLGGTGAANLLDDYEEGTWTPVFSDASSGGNTATANSGKRGLYTKIGNTVHVYVQSGNLVTTGMTGANDLYIQGLPFTPTSYSSPNQSSQGPTRLGDITFSGYVVAGLTDNQTYVRLQEIASGQAIDSIIVSQLESAAADVTFSITYTTAS